MASRNHTSTIGMGAGILLALIALPVALIALLRGADA